MDDVTEIELMRLQTSLKTIRRVAGWSVDDLARILGVSRQTISNLEANNGAKMSKMQYYAIRQVLSIAEKEPNGEVLSKTVAALVDNDHLTEQDRQNLVTSVSDAVSTIGNRSGIEAIAKLAGIAIASGLAIIGTMLTEENKTE